MERGLSPRTPACSDLYDLYDLEPGNHTITHANNERVEAELNLKIHDGGRSKFQQTSC